MITITFLGGRMTVAAWLFALIMAVVMTVLIHAAAGKLAAPSVTSAAVQELSAGHATPGPGWIRGLAGVELLSAVALVPTVSRLGAIVVITLLGLSFALLGILGVVRGSAAPCGCFGSRSTKPLGPANIIFGAALIAFGVLAGTTMMLTDFSFGNQFGVVTALLTVIGAAGWTVLQSRGRLLSMINRGLGRGHHKRTEDLA